MIITLFGLFLAGSAAAGPAPASSEAALAAAIASANAAVDDAARKDFETASLSAKDSATFVLRLRADFNFLASRVAARPGDQSAGEDLQNLEDRVRELDSQLAGLDRDLQGLTPRAAALVAIKDRVSFLPNLIVAARNPLQLIQRDAVIRDADFRRAGLNSELSRFVRALDHAAATAAKCLESSEALKRAVDAAAGR